VKQAMGVSHFAVAQGHVEAVRTLVELAGVVNEMMKSF